jgi:predicted protein tyrosine phosphatase
MSYFNRLGNVDNKFQNLDSYKRCLCVCSAGLLRSPTAAFVLSQEPYNYNTRSVGLSQEYALIPLDTVHIEWADLIVCMENSHAESIKNVLSQKNLNKEIISLEIPDAFRYRDPELINAIRTNFNKKYWYEKKGIV